MKDKNRAAWTAFVEGTEAPKTNKYGAERKGKYASSKEADYAMRLEALHSRGLIQDLREQVSFTLVEGQGKIRPIKYIADFCYFEDGKRHVVDVKGYTKNQVYRLKRKLMYLLLGIEIEEL